MALSKVGAATRALVAVLLVLARSYSLQLEVNRKPQSFWLCSPQQPSLGKVVWGALFWPRRQNGWGHDPEIALGKMHSDMSCIDQTSSDTTGVQYDSMTVAAHEKMYPLAQVLQALLLKLPW